MGERGYKFAVVNNMEVDKPHHVTLQKQKGETGDGLLEVECCSPQVCVCCLAAANEGSGKDAEQERNRRVDLYDEKVVQVASNFQTNQ